MFEYIALFASAFTVMIQHVFRQKFNDKGAKNAFLFSAITSFSAMLVFVATNTDWSFDIKFLGFSVAFALSYGTAVITSVLALLYGPLAKTSFFTACSLIIPSLYGFIKQGIINGNKEALSATLVVGLVLLLISLFLVNNEKDDKKPTMKWAILVFLCFLSNGLCSVVQVVKQEMYKTESNNMFMIIALFMVSVAMLIFAFSKKELCQDAGNTLKKGWLLGILCGCANGITNLLSLFLSGKLPPSIVFPVMSGGSLLLVFLWSFLVKKERYRIIQYIGYGISLIAIILLNI